MKGFSVDEVYQRSIAVGSKARLVAHCISSQPRDAEESLTAGLLHDIGKLILVSQLPEQYRQVIDLAREQKISLSTAEQAIFGVHQSAVGAYLIGLWGFVSPIVEAIGFNHALDTYPANSFTPALAVHVANVLYYRHRPDEIVGRSQDLHLPVIERLALQDKIPDWERICTEMMQVDEERQGS